MKTNIQYKAGDKVRFHYEGGFIVELLAPLPPQKGVVGNLWACKVGNDFLACNEDESGTSNYQVLSDYFFRGIVSPITPTSPNFENTEIAFLCR